MEYVLKLVGECAAAIEEFKITGEPIHFDERTDAVIIANELRKSGVKVLIEKSGNFFIVNQDTQ